MNGHAETGSPRCAGNRWTSAAALIMSIVTLLMVGAQSCLAQAPPGTLTTAPHTTVSGLSKGAWELSLATGYTYSFRRTDAHETKLRGIPVILGGGIVATDPIGASWYRGQITVGAEAAFIQYTEPLTAYFTALTPTVKYVFLPGGRLRPYLEAGAGVVWTDLGGRIPEKGSQFNFNLQVGVGLSFLFTPTSSLNLSYRFQHVSNAGTAEPNQGIDAGVVLIGVSRFF